MKLDTLYALKPSDIEDVHELITSHSLTITADNALRVAQLQQLFKSARPITEYEELRERCAMLEKQNAECLRVRDTALLEAGLAKRRADDAELALSQANEVASAANDALAKRITSDQDSALAHAHTA